MSAAPPQSPSAPRPSWLRRHAGLAALLMVAALVLVAGWRAFWFLTDDAYISFRYISNSVLGHGHVWNAPPFQPVEGYTNFLWIVLLEMVWRALAIEPPASCNVLSLCFSLLALALLTAMAARLDLRPALQRYRLAIVAAVVLGTATNRTFLTWSSSGLETALYNFLVLGWVYAVLCVHPGHRRRLLFLSAAAALAYLTRPDGVLYVAGTLALALADGGLRKDVRGAAAALWPLALVPVHLASRRSFYGDWLPNTYYAKHAGAWPQSGVRYALSFALEHALWVWLLCAVLWLLRSRRRGATPGLASGPRGPGRPGLELSVVTAVLGVHFLYYTFIIGGDHFEYRVYSHLVPLLFLGLVWLVNAASLRAAVSLALIWGAVLLTYPVPYTHWLHSRHLHTRVQTHKLRVPVADHWPGAFRWYARLFDQSQAWLIDHYVCVRHQEHKVNLAFIQSLFPDREEGRRLGPEGYPVFVFPAVGYAAWALPHVSILDTHGLNDRHVARTPIPPGQQRAMAHDRQPPPGYLECFRPNVRLLVGIRIEVVPRRTPLTAEDIRSCEARWSRRVAAMAP